MTVKDSEIIEKLLKKWGFDKPQFKDAREYIEPKLLEAIEADREETRKKIEAVKQDCHKGFEELRQKIDGNQNFGFTESQKLRLHYITLQKGQDEAFDGVLKILGDSKA